MNKRIYLIVSVVFIAIVVSLLIWLLPSQQETLDIFESLESQKNEQVSKSNSPTTNHDLTEAQVLEHITESVARRKFVTLDEKQLREGILNKNMFYLSDVDIVSLHNPIPLTDAQKNDGRIFLSNNLYTLEGKSIGDQIEFNVPGALKRDAVIDRIEVSSHDDIISWSGYIKGEDQNKEKFYITQTIKDNFTLGTIVADDKTYSILMKNGYGWMNDMANE